MGQDTRLKEYFNDNIRYADLINGMIGHGKNLVSAEHLTDMDSQIGYLPEDDEQSQAKPPSRKGRYHRKIRPKYRYMIRKVAFGMNFVVIGIENQELTHYLMPLRCMGYDAREYERQSYLEGKQILADHKKKIITLSDAEFLSRFRKYSKLHPCITLVLFFGDQWDGPTTLSDLLDYQAIPEDFYPFINDYRIHILPVKQLTNTDMFHSDLKLVLDSIRYADDKECFQKYILDNPEYQTLEEDTYHIILHYTNSKELQELNEKKSNKGGPQNMCKAITDLILDGKKEGQLEGKLEERRQIIRALFKNGADRDFVLKVVSITESELNDILAGE